MNRKEMDRKTSKSQNSPQYVMKSTLGDGFDDGDKSGQTELNSNFPDRKPSRPTFYKKEFKKLREGLQLDGDVSFTTLCFITPVNITHLDQQGFYAMRINLDLIDCRFITNQRLTTSRK